MIFPLIATANAATAAGPDQAWLTGLASVVAALGGLGTVGVLIANATPTAKLRRTRDLIQNLAATETSPQHLTLLQNMHRSASARLISRSVTPTSEVALLLILFPLGCALVVLSATALFAATSPLPRFRQLRADYETQSQLLALLAFPLALTILGFVLAFFGLRYACETLLWRQDVASKYYFALDISPATPAAMRAQNYLAHNVVRRELHPRWGATSLRRLAYRLYIWLLIGSPVISTCGLGVVLYVRVALVDDEGLIALVGVAAYVYLGLLVLAPVLTALSGMLSLPYFSQLLGLHGPPIDFSSKATMETRSAKPEDG